MMIRVASRLSGFELCFGVGGGSLGGVSFCLEIERIPIMNTNSIENRLDPNYSFPVND